MTGSKGAFEEIQKLAKSTLASQVKDALDSAGSSDEQKVTAVRGLIVHFIDPVAVGTMGQIKALAKSVLAHQIDDVLHDESMLPEEKVEHVRGLVQFFIVDPGK